MFLFCYLGFLVVFFFFVGDAAMSSCGYLPLTCGYVGTYLIS